MRHHTSTPSLSSFRARGKSIRGRASAEAPPDGLAHLLDHARFEILPSPGIEVEVTRHLPPATMVHVVCPATLGVDVSVSVAVELHERGYEAVPHVAARTVRDPDHLRRVLDRLAEVGITKAFFPGGDGKYPIGTYSSAVELLADLARTQHSLTDIGVTAYPQGHPFIPSEVLLEALRRKQEIATFMVSETCLDPETTICWLREMREAGVTLPLMVGVPGKVRVGELMKALRQFGLSSALGYLKKQHGMLGAILRRRFSRQEIVFGIAPYVHDEALQIERAHFFTFNEIAATEVWREGVLDNFVS